MDKILIERFKNVLNLTCDKCKKIDEYLYQGTPYKNDGNNYDDFKLLNNFKFFLCHNCFQLQKLDLYKKYK